MKIRQGFISNSSTSSFCIYGVSLEHKDLFDLAVRLGFEIKKKKSKTKEKEHFSKFIRNDNGKLEDLEEDESFEYENYERYDLMNYINKQEIITVKCFDAYSGDYYYIGREFKSIGDKETGARFKKSVEDELDELDIDKSPKVIEEAWHD
jgi:hypothetical protein